jgi:hypothetical protein
LKETAEQIAPSLTLLYNQSLNAGVFPDEWKLANIVPVFKKEIKEYVENYRPISLLSIISKVLERCVLVRLRDHLLQMLHRAQHGFIPGRSCVTQLVEVLNYIGLLLDSGQQTDVIYLDMSKAFDKVQHSLVIAKLREFNISGSLLSWFTSYLCGRRQRVTVLGATSHEQEVTSGVPQGSILGPVLFVLYVNDLPKAVLSSKVACFADDTKVLKRVVSRHDSVDLQSDIDNLNSWAALNGLAFNDSKCKSQRITRRKTPLIYPYAMNGQLLSDVKQEKDLGVWIHSDLTWNKQVVEQSSKANKLLGFIKRSCKEIRNPRTRRCLFLAIVRPHIGYATQTWAPQTIELIKRVERVQRRASKFILNLPYDCQTTYKYRLIESKLLPLSFWHEYLDLVLLFKMMNGLVDVSDDIIPERIVIGNSRRTRATSNPESILLRETKCRTVTFQRSFINRSTRTWNILPDELRHQSLSLVNFKTLLLDYYRSALNLVYEQNNPRTWKSICPKCNKARSLASPISCCF